MTNKKEAIIFILLNCLAFTLSMTINKLINPLIPVSLKVLIRSSCALLFFSPVILKKGLSVFVSKRITFQLLRILLVFLAISSTYFTYSKLPFTIAISIGFTGPICTALLSYLILKDKLSIGQWIAILVGYTGVLLMVQPQGQINYAIYIAIIGNIITGLSLIYTKKLSQIDSTNTIIILGNVGIVFFASLWTLFCWLAAKQENPLLHAIWIMPTWKDLQLLIIMGLLGTAAQLFSLIALKYASPSFLSLFEYTRLILAVPIGIVLGETLPGYQEIIGIVIIVVSTIYSILQSNPPTNAEG